MRFATRVISGLVLLALVVIAVVAGGLVFGTLVVIGVTTGLFELSLIMDRLDMRPIPWIAYPLTVACALRFGAPQLPILEIAFGLAIVAGAVAALTVERSAARWAASVAASVYIGVSLGFFIGLDRWDGHTAGARLVVLAVGGTVLTDTAAYLTGLWLGRHRFFPAISPKKTVEGAVGGTLACTAGVAIAATAMIGLGFAHALALGLLIAVAAQLGDLAESALKRQAGVKDASQLIPGHGGLLDRLDSLILVGPVVFCYLKLISLP